MLEPAIVVRDRAPRALATRGNITMKLSTAPYLLLTLSFAALSLFTVPALADVPPPDQCAEDQVGKACDSARRADGSTTSGVCEKTTCTRASRKGPITYACAKCVSQEPTAAAATSAAAEPAPADPGPVKPAPSDRPSPVEPAPELEKPGTVPPASAASKGGCSLSSAQGGRGWALLVGALGVAAFTRRRQSAR
ncbi:MAG: hypothetical protein RJA70_4652 [Pseudomonadota bacterium]|jgi:MYXO-CTERM domain-containing protein